MPQIRIFSGLLLISIILLSFNFNSNSFQLENDSLLTISGRVMLYGKTIDNVKVSIFRNNEVIDSIFTGPDGKFKYDLMINSNYAFIFDDSGEYQKTLVIETFIPDNITEIKPYRCIIRLDAEFVDDPKNAEKYGDYPIGIVKFDLESGLFELDYHYSRTRIKEIK
jgi:hypothetical protein